MKKKILFVMDGLKVGGVESALISVLNRMNYEQYDVDLLLLHDHLDLADRIPANVGILNYEKNKESGRPLLFYWLYCAFRLMGALGMTRISCKLAKSMQRSLHRTKIRKILCRDYSAVIGYKQGEAEEFVANCIRNSNKTVFYHHGSIQDEAQHRQTFGKVQRIAAVSEGVRDILCRQYPKYANKIQVIPNYIEPENILFRAKEYIVQRERTGAVFCTVGRLSQEKRYDLVLETARILRDRKTTDFRWYIVGDGDQKQMLEERIRTYGLQKWVILTGQLKNPLPYIAACDAYVQTSEMESYGLAMQEALVLGKPVITTRTIGGTLLVTNGVNGFLVKDDPEDIINGILEAGKLPLLGTNAYFDRCVSEDVNTDKALAQIFG